MTDRYVYAVALDDEVHKVTSSGNEEWVYTGHSDSVFGVAVDPDGYVYSGSMDDEVHKITPTGNEEWVYTGHSDDVYGVAVDPGTYGAFPHRW